MMKSIIQVVRYALVLLAVFAVSCKKAGETTPQQQPNIVFIIADDLGWGDVGYNGQEKIKTPNIDRLAKEGMIFNQMYAGSPVCGPSRASIMTGVHTGHGTVRGNPRWSLSGKPVDFDPHEETLGEVLQKAGYTTAVVGKWGLAENLGATVPIKQGFDYFYGFNQHLPAHNYYPEQIWENDSLFTLPQNNTMEKKGEYVQELFTQKAIDFVERQQDDPFFLYLAFTTPHFELTIPDHYKEPYDSLNWPLRKMIPGHYRHDENGHVTYAAMVSKMDADIGRLVETLKNKGVYENTLIIFTSDNGHEYDNVRDEFFNSNGPFRGMKRDLYEGGIHMPFVAVWPGKINPGSVTEHQGAFWDLKATLAEVAGAEITQETDGISFLPTLTGGAEQAKHDYLYWEFNEHRGPVQALAKQEWKLVHFVETGTFELYNLEQDPSEQEDLAGQFPEQLQALKTLLGGARTEHPEFPLSRRE
ncbi:arylsulfatase [Robertkochia sediminum]|uniref:arylsulfatase n=1 Tax=Robertkochia sediminum TaxID=2785326 RepID=UPI001933D65F|nr:arylsulfatase [Robertkochia sediminum]MBL7473264.1 arylsulfatase [Robertkochia sediminum]